MTARDPFLSGLTTLCLGEIQGLGLWLDANEHKASLKTVWPSLSDILVAEEGRESGELFAVTGQEGDMDLLPLFTLILFPAKRVLVTLGNSRKWSFMIAPWRN